MFSAAAAAWSSMFPLKPFDSRVFPRARADGQVPALHEVVGGPRAAVAKAVGEHQPPRRLRAYGMTLAL